MKTQKKTDSIYSMSVTSRLTGLTPDTIRVWERRYKAVVPVRTEGNTRKYSSEDIRRLSLLREATAQGYSIKDIARLPEPELVALSDQTDIIQTGEANGSNVVSGDHYKQLRDEYMGAINRFDVRRAQKLLSRAAALMQPTDLIFLFVLPALREAGHLWFDGKMSVAHEHLISMQIRSVLVKMLDFPLVQPGAPKMIFTTPEGHLHEFGALVGALLAASRGFDAIYLGPNLPENDILLAVDLSRADLLLFGLLKNVEKELDALNTSFSRLADRVETWVGLPEDHPAAGGVSSVRYITSFKDLDYALTQRIS